MNNKLFKLSPSDFKFLFEDCKHCYYQKIVNGIALPSTPFPSIFSQMNSLIQDLAISKNLKDLSPELPSGSIIKKEGFSKSRPIPHSNNCFISGRYDLLAKLDDGTFCVIDLKISSPKDETIYKYAKQLHAYKYALENPADLTEEPTKISKMGLLVIAPESVNFTEGRIILNNAPTWIEVNEDMEEFFKFIDEVSTLLNGDCPIPSGSCEYCKYRIRYSTQPVSSV